jgi:hypothetical protein
MKNKSTDELLQRLKEAFDVILPPASAESYPEEALPVGTYVRSIRHHKLGVITDAFYGDMDADNQKIIIYTILLFPQVDPLTRAPKRNDQYYITNEYEYEIIAYLMMEPVDLTNLTASLGGGLFL